ncbi:hypothetical protein, partial [Bacillus sp. REN3]|uniref:hypothetical protein n=1 Tax=Bacillus sp. REN3 TaxID=2802440 RepID=UPI001AEEFE0F
INSPIPAQTKKTVDKLDFHRVCLQSAGPFRGPLFLQLTCLLLSIPNLRFPLREPGAAAIIWLTINWILLFWNPSVWVSAGFFVKLKENVYLGSVQDEYNVSKKRQGHPPR